MVNPEIEDVASPETLITSQNISPGSGFLEILASSKLPLIADGAMGTMLHMRGVGFDRCFDELNLSKPSLVAEIHRDYIEAG